MTRLLSFLWLYSTAMASVLPPEGLLGHWAFENGVDNAAHSTSVVTSSSLLPNGTLQNEADITETTSSDFSATPTSPQHLQLNGNGDYFDIPESPLFDSLQSNWSVATWFKPNQAPTGLEKQFIFQSSNAQSISLSIQEDPTDTSRTLILFQAQNASFITFLPDSEITNWNHAVITHTAVDPANSRFETYLNGKFSGSLQFVVSMNSSINGLHLGSNAQADGDWFRGQIDEFSMWNRTLSEDEVSILLPILVTDLGDLDDGPTSLSSPENLSLREAVNHSLTGSTIHFHPHLSSSSIFLSQGPLAIARNLQIDASSIGGIYVHGSPTSFLVSDGDDANFIQVSLKELNLVNENYDPALEGPALHNRENLLLDHCRIADFDDPTTPALSETAYGVGIYSTLGSLSLINSVIADNHTQATQSHGAGILLSGGQLLMENSIVSQNQTLGSNAKGGGIYMINGNASLVRSTVSACSTLGSNAEGGGIYISGGNITLYQSTISDNRTEGSQSGGGGIYLSNSSLFLNESSVSHNYTKGFASQGGGIYSDGPNSSLDRSTIANNYTLGTTARGGGIFNINGNLSLSHSTLSGNQTLGLDSDGAGLYNNSDIARHTTTLLRSTIANNTTVHSNGGGFYNFAGQAFIENCSIVGNQAPQNFGAGLAASSNSATSTEITNSIISGNLRGLDLALDGTLNTFSFTEENLIGSTQAGIDNSPATNSLPLSLTPLGYYGGPTQTIHPLEGSPAILSGNDTTQRDQRGFTFSGPPTLGAVKPGMVTEVSDEAELRSALANSSNSPGNIIRFHPELNGTTITLSGPELVIPSSSDGLFIDASPLLNGLTIDAAANSNSYKRALKLENGAIVSLHSLILTGGWIDSHSPAPSQEGLGAGILLEQGSKISISNSTITENRASQGGGIHLSSESSLILDRSTVSRNLANRNDGGGISTSANATLFLNRSTLSENRVTAQNQTGGGIFLDHSSRLTLHQSTVSHNQTHGRGLSSQEGAGLFISNSTANPLLKITNSIIAGNNGSSNDNIANSKDLSPEMTSDLSMNIVIASPLLAPLGDYGGPTQTMIPLPDSPVINAASHLNYSLDQRGQSITDGTIDMGATEFQDETDIGFLPVIWLSDSDQDGAGFGLELALGTSPTSHTQPSQLIPSFTYNELGESIISFTFSSEAVGQAQWIIERSSDLITWHSIYSSNDPNAEGTTSSLVVVQSVNNGIVTLVDQGDLAPNQRTVFYRIRSDFR